MKRVDRLSFPLLDPHVEAIRLLQAMPRDKLLAAIEQRAITAPARATRPQLARLLVRAAAFAKAEAHYRESGTSFEARDAAYPFLRKLLYRARMRHVIDFGCGPGLFAGALRPGRALPSDGSYLGIDISPTAIELARARLAGDTRFTFRVGGVGALGITDEEASRCDGIISSFALSYLDTHEVHRVIAELARRCPRATMIVALTVRSCVDRRDDEVPESPAKELAAARRWLKGDRRAATQRWDVRRFDQYRASLNTYYRVVEQHARMPLAQVIWIARPRRARVPRP